MKKTLQFLFVFAIISNNILAQLPAFPTAEGAGKFTTGGRGTTSVAPTIYIVTNLGDANTNGSFRYACSNGTAARIIVFRVSGTIHLTSAITLKANTTIAGQTAPGEGICIADYPVSLGGNNIIVRYIRFRLGDKNELVTTPANCAYPNFPTLTPFNPPTTPFPTTGCFPTANSSGNNDAFGDNGQGRTGIIIDHCTSSWSNDEAFTIYKGNNVTVQWCFITEPLNYSFHVETGDTDYELHAFGGIWGGTSASFHHNLLAHCKGRMPRFDGRRNIAAENVDFRNNVLYNWGDYNTNGGEGGSYNVVNNYYKWGPNTASVATQTNNINKRNMVLNPYKKTTAPTIPYGNYYLTGNYCDNSAAVTADNWLGVAYNSTLPTPAELTAMQLTTPVVFANAINTETAADAYNNVLANGGCKLPARDTLDERIVNNVKNRTGGIIDVQGGFPHGTSYVTSQVAWPNLAGGTAQADFDSDGMPDSWEDARGLDRTSALDRNNYTQSTSGYNNIENYINGDTIVAIGKLENCVTAKKIVSINSAQWLFARDSVPSTFNAASYTAAVDSNQIVAGILDNGNFGEFTISYYTTNSNRSISGLPYGRRNITITPTNPALITSPVTVRLFISLAEFNALKAADATLNTIADIAILKTSDNTCINTLPASYSVIIPTATSLFGTYKNGYYLEFQTTSFSTFFFASKNNSLIPITLSEFDVVKEKNTDAKITWATEQEINTKDFEIQRSTNATNWTTIKTLNASGNSSITLHYNFTDTEKKYGIYYYRLKQNDLNGLFTFSPIKKIAFSTFKEINIYPNPVKNYLTIEMNTASNYNFILLDALGKKVFEKNINNSSTLDFSKFNNGIYIAKVTNNTESFYYKILISK